MTYEDYPDSFVTICVVIIVIVATVGFFFNLAVLLVYHLNQKSMKDVSNLLITNLNITDMLICIMVAPVTSGYISSTRFHNPLFCYFHEAAVSFGSTACAVNLLIISFDRYESVVCPMKRKIKETNVKAIIRVIWILAIIAVLVPFCGYIEALSDITKTEQYEYSNDTIPCTYWFHNSRAFYVHELYYVTTFLISSIGTLVCYYRVFRLAKRRLAVRIALLKASLTFPGSNPSIDARRQEDRRVTKMTLAIVCAFMICWGPNMTITVIGLFMSPGLGFEMAQMGLLSLAYLTTVLHPLLYAFMRQNFRKALREKWRTRPMTNSKISPNQPPQVTRQLTLGERRNTMDILPTVMVTVPTASNDYATNAFVIPQ